MGTWIKINRVNTVSVKMKSYFTITLAVLEGTIVQMDNANLANILRNSATSVIQRVSKIQTPIGQELSPQKDASLIYRKETQGTYKFSQWKEVTNDVWRGVVW